MAFNTFLNYMEKSQRICNIKYNDIYLSNIKLKRHIYSDKIPDLLSLDLGGIWETYSETRGAYLEFETTEGHIIWVDIRDLKEIRFDAIVSMPKTAAEMKDCIKYLEENNEEPYNVYLMNSKGEFVLDLLRVQKPGGKRFEHNDIFGLNIDFNK